MKNVKNIIMNAGVILAGLLVYILGGVWGVFEGIGYLFQVSALAGIGQILIVILTAAAMAIAVVNILADCGVIKNEKVRKILYLVNFILTILVALGTILYFVGALIAMGVVIVEYIVLVVFGLATFVFGLLGYIFAKKN